MKVFRRRITDSSTGPATYIAPDSKITGSLSGEGSYVFCGRMDGDCDIDGTLTLAETGHWVGTLKATNVIVAGTVDGDVIASERVEIAGTARISGSLSGRSIAVAEGAVIQGKIMVTSGAEPKRFEEKRGADAQKLATG
jgi:cytoskeletal protein CcmA (bactofilin family)